jgi:hypothetical protein
MAAPDSTPADLFRRFGLACGDTFHFEMTQKNARAFPRNEPAPEGR